MDLLDPICCTNFEIIEKNAWFIKAKTLIIFENITLLEVLKEIAIIIYSWIPYVGL